jgi:uncharacterized protein
LDIEKVQKLTEEAVVDRQKKFLLEFFAGLGEVDGRTKLQKIVFLGQQELGLKKIFDFNEYYYGPYSEELTDILEQLIRSGDIIENIEMHDDYVKYTYHLSKFTGIPDETVIPENIMDSLKRLSGVPRKKIIDYVYRKYLPHRL